jgi:hypothetical protein
LTQDEKLKGRIRDSVSGTLGLKEGELSVAFLEKDVDGNENGSRFAIIACVSERATRLADLADVNYWKDSPCPEWMQKCEQKDGESFFVSDDGNKGVGFTDPVFVRDPVFSDLRWKPWMVIVDDEKAKAIAPVYDAMIYALMDVVKIPGPEGEIVRNAMARCNWQLPLVIRGDTESNNRYQFTRRAYREYKPGISDTPRENTKSWNRKQGFGLGVRSVLGVFSGTDSHKEDKGIEWRQCILEEKAIFDKVILGDNGIEGMARTKFFTAIIDQFAALRDEDFNIEPDRVVWQELIDYLEKIRS